MITKHKVILVTNQRSDFLERFEALEYIDNGDQIREVMNRNKTPIVVAGNKKISQLSGYSWLYVPEKLIGDIDGFTEFCHNYEFECGEYSTGEWFDTRLERCFMCEIANHKGFQNLYLYNKFIDNTVDCIIYESDNFYVIPELGGLKQGFLMIIPKKHYYSVAQYPKELMAEYQEVCEDVESILLKTFNGHVVSFMEHGTSSSGMAARKRSIVHAHTHVIVDFTLKPKYLELVHFKPCNDISIAKDTHYASYQEGSKGQLYIAMDHNVYIQRQYFRQVMAHELGFAPDQYNWHVYEFDEITDATLFYLCKMLKKESEGRIFERTKDFVKGFSERPKKK